MEVHHGPEYNGLRDILTPQPIEWRTYTGEHYKEVFIAGRMIGFLQPRPSYCDRGHFQVTCLLPDLDAADMFPRYYMNEDVAIQETEAFLRWRLWRQR